LSLVAQPAGLEAYPSTKYNILMLNLFTIPAATTTIAAISEYSSPWFTELLPVVYVAVGVFLGVSFLIFLINIIKNALNNLINNGKDTVIYENDAGKWESHNGKWIWINK